MYVTMKVTSFCKIAIEAGACLQTTKGADHTILMTLFLVCN